MDKIFILGSSRSFGNTRKIVDRVMEGHSSPLIDLKTLDISSFDYEHKNESDDFIPVIRNILNYQTIILASPIYWYSMSGIMKTFLDRFTDLITIQKDMGRQLKGKNVYLLSSFNASHHQCFEDPFILTCQYLGMNYLGGSFIQNNDNDDKEIAKRNDVEIQKARTVLNLDINE